MFKEDYSWNFDYVRLSLDSGFAFEKHKSENLDKSKISLIDLDRVIEERDIATVDKFIPCVLKFALDPEHVKLLDDSFVKTFRLSQLAVQYLLFCKKYLDNSLISIKKKLVKLEEENRELNLFIDDLKQHVNTLLKDKALANSFKCEECDKLFSTQEFLNSHKKRRHSQNSLNSQTEAETDKLQMEIKELKGRLNTAEKLLHEEIPKNDSYNKTESKLNELYHKFEDLRVQVQSELKVLKTQQDFEEKYEKWVEKMAFANIKTSPHKKADENKVTYAINQRRESTTQTDDTDSVICNQTIKLEPEKLTDADSQKQIEEIGVALELKMSSSLQKIEDHMQSFWHKLNEIESKREASPPSIKPRSKYTVKREITPKIEDNETGEPVASNSSKITPNKEKTFNVEVVHNPPAKLSEFQTTSPISESSESLESDSSYQKQPLITKIVESAPKIETKSAILKSKPKKHLQNPLDDDILSRFRLEVEKILMQRLQDLGISPEWTGLPTRSYNRALEIVMHQANLLKKNYPDFGDILASIETQVSKEISSRKNTKIKIKNLPKQHITSKVLTSVRGKTSSPIVEIKNRKMYETDSESEMIASVPKIREDLQKIGAPYSAVIQELKSVNANKTPVEEEKENIKKDEAVNKGVLKNYPSVGSLVTSKKKVLFNLDNENQAANHKIEGDSTSVASSMLDEPPTKAKIKMKANESKEVEDLSDLDFDF